MPDRRVTLVDSEIVDRILDRLLLASAAGMPPGHGDGVDSARRQDGQRLTLAVQSSAPRNGVSLLALRCARR